MAPSKAAGGNCTKNNQLYVSWCNGSTADFGSVSRSSNLCGTTNIIIEGCKISIINGCKLPEKLAGFYTVIRVKYSLYTPVFYNVNNKIIKDMPSFTHLIITRFMCDNFIKKDTGIDIDNEEWTYMSFDMARRHIIPTLENQSNKNFILVFLVSDYMDDDDRCEVQDLSDILIIHAIRLSDFNNYIKQFDTDYLITSRLDYDDHVYKDCVKDIHQLLKDKKPEVCIYGLNQGVSIVDGENESHLMYNYPWLLGEGFPAPMTTLILARSACKEYFDIYKLGFHTECVKCLLGTQGYYLNKIYDIHQIYAQHKGYDIDYIWIRHPHSATTISLNVIHTTNILVELSDKELKENFGYIV